jgi:hypothetical protein
VIASHTALLVAPEGEARDVLLRALRSSGYLVSVATSACSAIEFLSGVPYDLIACGPVFADAEERQFLFEVQRRCPASAVLLLGPEPADSDLDLELLFRVSRWAARRARHAPARGRALPQPPEGGN